MAAAPDGGEWTFVLPRRRRRGTQNSKTLNPEPHTTLEPKPSPPIIHSQTNTQIEESKLMKKMQLTLTNLESSSFYRTLVAQIQTPQLLSNFSRALSSSQSQNKMQMVIYGIGSIDSYEPPRLQLSLAILLSRRFDSMIEGRIEVFDPIIAEVESRVMEALGCTVLKIDEQGRREAERPMLFFMPHCEVELYNNLLEANWRPERLNRMVVFGNSFERYHSFVSEFKCSVVGKYSGYVLEARRFAEEVGIDTVCEDFFRAFHDTSWHFFCLDADVAMEEMNVKQLRIGNRSAELNL
ncbi:hypothetical protein AAC387_Pa08g2115 [Persea americana]